MPRERKGRTGAHEITRSVADRAALVWRLALDAGLTPEQAEDVCVVTLQDAVRADTGSESLDTCRRGWLLRTALEQCAVARTLASDSAAPPYPDDPEHVAGAASRARASR